MFYLSCSRVNLIRLANRRLNQTRRKKKCYVVWSQCTWETNILILSSGWGGVPESCNLVKNEIDKF